MELILHHNELTIRVFDDSAFTASVDSPTFYQKVIQLEQEKKYRSNTHHAIKVYKDDHIMSSAIILGTYGATCVQEDTALIDEGNLIICCNNQLYSLSLPELNINWMVEPDQATCFEVHKYRDSFITYGELCISRIDRSGKILWQFSGADIFVCLNEGNPFEMFDDHIALTDFQGRKYKIDYDGKIIK